MKQNVRLRNTMSPKDHPKYSSQSITNCSPHRQQDRSPSGYSFSPVLLLSPSAFPYFCSVLILTCPPEGLLAQPGDLEPVIKFSLGRPSETICSAAVWHLGCCAVNFRYLISHYQQSSTVTCILVSLHILSRRLQACANCRLVM